MVNELKLGYQTLRPIVDLKGFEFTHTGELTPLDGPLGQERAFHALEFGLNKNVKGFHIYVTGLPGSGRSFMVKQILESVAKTQDSPPDLCFVQNFKDSTKPVALHFNPKEGRTFKNQIEKLISDLKIAIPKIFESTEYIQDRSHLAESNENERENLITKLNELAKQKHIFLDIGTRGIRMVPEIKGEPIKDEDVKLLSENQRAELLERLKEFQPFIRDFHIQSHQLDQKFLDQIKDMDRKWIESVLDSFFSQIMIDYQSQQKVFVYLQNLKTFICDNFIDFLPKEDRRNLLFEMTQPSALSKYSVNLVVENEKGAGAPIIRESHPTFLNLIGRVERRNQFGVVFSDFTDIRAGALLKANGGYLVLRVKDLFSQPFSWDALKRALKSGYVIVEDVSDYIGISPVAIKPEGVPVSIKVILIGSPSDFNLLHYFDEDFSKIFKIKCEMESEIVRSSENVFLFARYISRICKEEGFQPLSKEGLGELLIEFAKKAEHRAQISLDMQGLNDILNEASHLSSTHGEAMINAKTIEQVLYQRLKRLDLIKDHWLREFEEGTFLIDLNQSVIGQVNALSIVSSGDLIFGKPCRITARTFSGGKGVIDIQKESHLGGAIHSKGVMTLSGFLSGLFGELAPIGLSATLTFEQVYSEVEGDSASAAELIAILSSLSETPIRQDIALTGSINQLGEVQPIGGVNEKIEGFFDICKIKGLTGKQGVIIPARNIKNLVLKKEIVQAVKEDLFSIYFVTKIEEAIEILTGIPAGSKLYEGGYLEGTLYNKVESRIIELENATLTNKSD